MKVTLPLFKKHKEKKYGWLIILLANFFILAILTSLIISPVLAYEFYYQNKIFPGVYVDSINIGGLPPSEAIDKLNQHADNIKSTGLNFYYKNQRFNINTTTLSPADPDLAYQILSF